MSEIESHPRCAGASCSCNDAYAQPQRNKNRAAVTPFSGPIAGTAGVRSTRTPGKRQGDQPLSVDAQEFEARLWRETHRSLRLDEAKFGEIRRWPRESLRALREQERQQQKAAESA